MRLEYEATESLDRLRSEELDIASVYIYDHAPLDAGRAIEIRNLMHDPAHVAVPCPLTRSPDAPKSRCASWPASAASPGPGHRIPRPGCVPRRRIRARDRTHRHQRLPHRPGARRRQIGAAFIPQLAQQPDRRLAFLTPMDPVGRTIAAAHRAGGRRSRAVATMIDILEDTPPRGTSSHTPDRR